MPGPEAYESIYIQYYAHTLRAPHAQGTCIIKPSVNYCIVYIKLYALYTMAFHARQKYQVQKRISTSNPKYQVQMKYQVKKLH